MKELSSDSALKVPVGIVFIYKMNLSEYSPAVSCKEYSLTESISWFMPVTTSERYIVVTESCGSMYATLKIILPFMLVLIPNGTIHPDNKEDGRAFMESFELSEPIA